MLLGGLLGVFWVVARALLGGGARVFMGGARVLLGGC